jgi:hypothetical protein
MIKCLSNISKKVKPVYRDYKIIDFIVYFGRTNYLKFRDSLLLLPLALEKLGDTFITGTKVYFLINL